LNNLYIFVLQI